jgi:hypothetical protein
MRLIESRLRQATQYRWAELLHTATVVRRRVTDAGQRAAWRRRSFGASIVRRNRAGPGWRGSRGRVDPNPSPSQCLSQGPMDNDMDPVDGARRQPTTVTSATAEQVGVEVVEVLRR